MSLMDHLMGGHDCKKYIHLAKKGEVYTCCCGAKYRLVRTFPWRKWERV